MISIINTGINIDDTLYCHHLGFSRKCITFVTGHDHSKMQKVVFTIYGLPFHEYIVHDVLRKSFSGIFDEKTLIIFVITKRSIYFMNTRRFFLIISATKTIVLVAY